MFENIAQKDNSSTNAKRGNFLNVIF